LAALPGVRSIRPSAGRRYLTKYYDNDDVDDDDDDDDGSDGGKGCGDKN
jgi:hypothetical protein